MDFIIRDIAKNNTTNSTSYSGGISYSGGGSGLIKTVYGYSNINDLFADTDLSSTFNAYSISTINNRLVTVENKNYLAGLTSTLITNTLGYIPYNSNNPSGYITSSSLNNYLSLTGGTLTGQLNITSDIQAEFDNNVGSIYTLGGITAKKSIQANDFYSSTGIAANGDIYAGGSINAYGSITANGGTMNGILTMNDNFLYVNTLAHNNGKIILGDGLHLDSFNGKEIILQYYHQGTNIQSYGNLLMNLYNITGVNSITANTITLHGDVYSDGKFIGSAVGLYGTAPNMRVDSATKLWCVNYPNDYYLTHSFDGNYFQLTSNYNKGVNVAHSDNSTYATTAGNVNSVSSALIISGLGYTPYNATNPNGYITSYALSPYQLSSTAINTSNIGSQSVNYSNSANSANYANSAGSANMLNGSAHTNGSDGWFRSAGNCGWYNETYATGIYSTESGNVRTYNNASFIANNITASGQLIVNSTVQAEFDNNKGAIYCLGGITTKKSMQCNDVYVSNGIAANGDIYIGGSFNGSGSGLSGTANSLNVNYANYSGSLNSSNYISQRGATGTWNGDFQATPAGTLTYGGDVGASGTNNAGGSWWFQQNFRHTNSSNYWGVQVAWGWEDNANKLATRNISGGSYSNWVYYLNSSNFGQWAAATNHVHDAYATHRPEGTQYIDYARCVFNNGAYSGSGWVEPSDLGVRYANSANYANSAGSASANDVYSWAKQSTKPSYGYSEVGAQAPITVTTNNTSGAATFSGNVLNIPNYSVAATSYDAAHSFATAGYQKLSNGMIMQWGTNAANSNVTFPIAFPNAVLSIHGSNISSNNTEAFSFTSLTRTGFYFNNYGKTNTGMWFAIGY